MNTIITLFDIKSDVHKNKKLVALYIEGIGHVYNLGAVTNITFNEKSKLWYIEFDKGKDKIYSTSNAAVRILDDSE